MTCSQTVEGTRRLVSTNLSRLVDDHCRREGITAEQLAADIWGSGNRASRRLRRARSENYSEETLVDVANHLGYPLVAFYEGELDRSDWLQKSAGRPPTRSCMVACPTCHAPARLVMGKILAHGGCRPKAITPQVHDVDIDPADMNLVEDGTLRFVEIPGISVGDVITLHAGRRQITVTAQVVTPTCFGFTRRGL